MRIDSYIKKFGEFGLADTASVGGKNSSPGEMISKLSTNGSQVPGGFATTAFAFERFLTHNSLHLPLHKLMSELDKVKYENLEEIGSQARALILNGRIPHDMEVAILAAYGDLCGNRETEVAVRSSATAEELPQASFAGQHESCLHIEGPEALLKAIKKCFASLYTNRAIKYREYNGIVHESVFISVGVTKLTVINVATPTKQEEQFALCRDSRVKSSYVMLLFSSFKSLIGHDHL